MSKTKYATKEDVERLERKIDILLKDVQLIKEEIEYLEDDEIKEIDDISRRIKEGKEKIISLEEFKKRYENEI